MNYILVPLHLMAWLVKHPGAALVAENRDELTCTVTLIPAKGE